MNITSKIYLETNINVCLNIVNCKLYYELECINNNFDEEYYKKFNIYKKNNEGLIKYKNIYYKQIHVSQIEKNKPLAEGVYLFVFNKTKIFIEFMNNKISFETEDDGIETEIDLS